MLESISVVSGIFRELVIAAGLLSPVVVVIVGRLPQKLVTPCAAKQVCGYVTRHFAI